MKTLYASKTETFEHMKNHFELENCDEKLIGMSHVYGCHINRKTGINSINLAWTGPVRVNKKAIDM